MKKIFTVLMVVCLTTFAGQARADHGFFGGYIGLDVNGGGNNFYGLQQPGPNTLTAFDGHDFGIFDLSLGNSLLISGGEGLTFKNGGDNVTGVNLNWRVYPTGSPSGAFNFIVLDFTTDQPFNDAASNPFSTTGDQKWANIQSTPNVLADPAITGNGNYTLEVYLSGFGFNAAGAPADFFLNNFSEQTGPLNYKATFTVIPEPTSFMLAALGVTGAGLLLRRKS